MKDEIHRLLKMIAMGRPDAAEPLAELLAGHIAPESPVTTVIIEPMPADKPKRKKAE